MRPRVANTLFKGDVRRHIKSINIISLTGLELEFILLTSLLVLSKVNRAVSSRAQLLFKEVLFFDVAFA
jgi:hypothetical protein